MKQKPGYTPPHPLEGERIRINVLLDRESYDIAKKYGHNNVSAGLRQICKDFDKKNLSK